MFTTRPELRGTFGMVASTHWLASAAGMAVLERGGNAFDAAVAAGFTLQVVEPHLNGPGGDLPAIVWRAGDPAPRVLCAQGPAPAAATIERYRDELGLTLVPGTGPLAACVPGSFGGWIALLRDYGTMELADVLQYAVHYAEHGIPVLPQIAGAIGNVEALFRDEWTASGELYLGHGDVLKNPTLAQTYRRLLAADDPMEAWYRGFVAEAIVEFQQDAFMDSSGERHSGLLSEDDLATWQPRWEDALSVDYHGHTVYKAGPWSQAPVFLQQLRLLEGFDLGAMAHVGADYVHTITECAKLAFADREAWYGDPDFVDVPLELLLSREYADERRRLVGDTASAELRPGGEGWRLPGPVEAVEPAPGVGEPTRGDTVHLDVVDRWGNMVAATPSGGWLWGAPVIPELGFPLGTRAQMFWLEHGLPNSLAPRKRPRTTLSPTMVAREGEPYLALGTPGGDQQDQWTLHVFLGRVHHGLNLQAAIDAPNHHTGAFPSSFYPRESVPRHVAVEARAGEATLDGLRARGHDVEASGDWALGRVSAVSRERDGWLRAAANPRGMQGYAAGR